MVIFRNYGPTLKQGNDVVKAGHNQVLWLYGDEVIEAGTSNIFFIFKGSRGDGKIEIVTPALRDLILPGVTRDSIMVKKFL
jgi:branched-chain amino acid aminotransferase